jgi:hypothetical protein
VNEQRRPHSAPATTTNKVLHFSEANGQRGVAA